MTTWCVVIHVNPGAISDLLVYVVHVISHLVNVHLLSGSVLNVALKIIAVALFL